MAEFVHRRTETSRILFISHTSTTQMVIMRTGSGPQPNLNVEFVWVRHGGKVYFYSDGLELKVTLEIFDDATISVRPKGSQLPYFDIEGEDAREYIDRWYEDELDEVLEEVEERLETQIETRERAVSVTREREPSVEL